MARINIEDELHADVRFIYLARRLGDPDKAIGMLYRFWRYAQKYWADGKKLIPTDFFELEGLQPVAEIGLAEIKPEGVYAKGASERFEWYRQKRAKARAAAMKRWHPETQCDGNADALPNACPLVPAPVPAQKKETNAQPDGRASLPLEALYDKYPRHEGKKRGLEIARRQIKTNEEFERLSLAIDRYKGQVQREQREKKYIKQFSSFMSCWEDWLEPTIIAPAAGSNGHGRDYVFQGAG